MIDKNKHKYACIYMYLHACIYLVLIEIEGQTVYTFNVLSGHIAVIGAAAVIVKPCIHVGREHTNMWNMRYWQLTTSNFLPHSCERENSLWESIRASIDLVFLEIPR